MFWDLGPGTAEFGMGFVVGGSGCEQEMFWESSARRGFLDCYFLWV